MAASGYSGTPLAKKLGIQDGSTVQILNEPDGFAVTLGELPAGARRTADDPGQQPDLVLIFAADLATLEASFAEAASAIPDNGCVWVAWPKKASGVETDLAFDVVQGHGLTAGLVDTKVCAVDETWSGLKFMYRKKDRGKRTAQ